jgi:hypothetical protein
MHRILARSWAVALLTSVAFTGAAAAAPPTYRTSGTATCDGQYRSGYTVTLWSKNPATRGATQVGSGLFFCEGLDGTPYVSNFWTDTSKPATWAVISWAGVSGQCADGPRAYQLPTPVVRNQAPCGLANYSVSVQLFASVRN